MKKILKYTGITIGAITAVGLLFVTVGFMPKSTDQIEQLAAQFQPDASWKLESESIEPGRFICLNGHCDQLRKVWSLPQPQQPLTREGFEEMAKLGSQSIPLEESCFVNPYNGAASDASCSARLRSGGYDATVEYSNHTAQSPQMILNIQR